jgi:hypothetical protein
MISPSFAMENNGVAEMRRMAGRVSEKVSHGSGSVVLLRATAKGGQWLA